ncbi:MAG TPA: glycosyltransferase [Pyrinomonadaceae bacterium]|nr:glycosyltransferase [Pyrinomonadaceae bacterium]
MRTLASFQHSHSGADIVVCGCGESLKELARPERFLTIGVNDVGRLFTPDYLVVVNPRSQFAGDRFGYVERSRSRFIFTQLNLGPLRAPVVKFRLGRYGGTDFADTEVLHYTQNSPYVAMCLAAHMGARRIGLIGVDFTNHHFFAPTGTHALTAQLKTIDEQYRRLGESLCARGIEVFNLSSASRLTAFPKLSVEQFASTCEQSKDATDEGHASEAGNVSGASEFGTRANASEGQALRIVSYSTTPVAGVPAILARCIASRTPHEARCVWAQNGYGNGVTFEGDIEWTSRRAVAEEELKRADLVVVHNGKVDPRHRRLIAGKPVVTMAHNYIWNVEQNFVREGFPGVVVGQYQASLAEFAGWSSVPNPVPVWETAYQPEPKGEAITICYTPSGKHEKYPEGHRLYWHSKGFETTMRVVERLAARFPLKLEVTRERQVSHAGSLAMKRRAHVVIDECVTGSYHRNSLEGLAAGCVVVNGLGLRPEVVEVFKRCAPRSLKTPFVFASLDDLERVLEELIGRGAQRLASEGEMNRRWMEEHWDFAEQWESFWIPVVANAFERAGRAWPTFGVPRETRAAPNAQKVSGVEASEKDACESKATRTPLHLVARTAPVEAASRACAASVVIPHGGLERLPHLAATLANLKQINEALEVSVVEMDAAPRARDVARELADSYAFIRDEGIFHKPRAMNAGLAFARRSEIVLWLDNDILLPRDFLSKALAEMHRRRLDCLVPWTSVRYLSAEDTEAFFANQRGDLQSCRHVNAYFTRQGACGGAVLVRRDFLARHGGMCEEFRGWGGEDNAWFYKARVLGRAAVTERQDQHLYHLFHRNSGGYDATNHLEKNPHYNENVRLLQETRSLRDRAQVQRRFPPPAYFTCPWDIALRVAFVRRSDDAHACAVAEVTASALEALYGLRVERLSEHEIEALRECGAAVVFGVAQAFLMLSDERLRSARLKILVAHAGERPAPLCDEEKALYARAFAHFALDAGAARLLEEAGFERWLPLGGVAASAQAEQLALGLAQPLSLALSTQDATGNDAQTAPLAQAHRAPSPNMFEENTGYAIGNTTAARKEDLALTEFSAFNHGRNYPQMRRWEMPFALFKARLSSTSCVLDCTINPLDFGDRLQSLYPHALYRHWNPVQRGEFRLPVGVPDGAFDRVVCINTLEHLLSEQREALVRELALKLKPGGLLVLTSDFYFEDFWSRPELQRMGVVRADRQEIFGGWNRVAPEEILRVCASNGLHPLDEGAWHSPEATDPTLYRNVEPHPHACIAAVFSKGKGAALIPDGRKIALSLLTWNTRDISLDALGALVREAAMLRRLGHEPFVVVCDNGSTDGLREALSDADGRIEIEHCFILNPENRGSSVARNQIIDLALENDADYLFMTDGDIELVPFSSFAMLRHMEDCGHTLGCLGAAMYGQSPLREETTPYLYSLAGLPVEEDNLLAWTQYGMFRREVFEAGVRFDVTHPFDREGWGCEDNDLAFQMHVKGFAIRRFGGMTYLHRSINSSVRVLRSLGVDPSANYERRRRYVIDKWAGVPSINDGPLRQLRNFRMRFSA